MGAHEALQDCRLARLIFTVRLLISHQSRSGENPNRLGRLSSTLQPLRLLVFAPSPTADQSQESQREERFPVLRRRWPLSGEAFKSSLHSGVVLRNTLAATQYVEESLAGIVT